MYQMKVKVLDLEGKLQEELNIEEFEKDYVPNADHIARFIRVFQTNQRQGTSKTKKRSEVRGGGKKPWKQKGTGRARAGSSRSPLWVGGGTSNGPKPKSWTIRSTKELKLSALKSALALKIADGTLNLVDWKNEFEKASSKKASALSNKFEGRTLVVHDARTAFQSFRNLKNTQVATVKDVNAYDITRNAQVIFEKGAFQSLIKKFAHHE